MNIAIVGLGLMGGSLALSLKKLDFIGEIVGSDHNKKHQEDALKLNLVEKIIDFKEVKNYDVIFLAIPVDGIISAIKNMDKVDANTTIIDLGGTKSKIINAIPTHLRKNFIAAHPMTGTEFFGPYAALDGLYNNKIVVLCDLENSGKHQQKISKQIFKALGMKKTFMKATEHDRHAAFISHMPHAISYSLANTVMKQEKKKNILALAAGGFRSMSRLAKSSPDMWEDIFKQNKNNILEAITLFEDELKILKHSIEEDNWEKVNKIMTDGNKLHDILE